MTAITQSKDSIKTIKRDRLILIILFVLSFVGVSIYYSYREYNDKVEILREEKLTFLKAIVSTAATQFDGDTHQAVIEKYTKKDDIVKNNQDSDYKILHNLLLDLYNKNELKSPIYTMIKNPGAKISKLENSFSLIITSDKEPYFRHPYTPPKEVFEQYGKVGSYGPYKDEHGEWLSAFAPIKNKNGKVVAMIQADMNLMVFEKEIFDRVIKRLVISVVVLIVILIIVFVFVNKITKSMVGLQRQVVSFNNELESKNDLLKEQEEELRQNNEELHQFADQLSEINREMERRNKEITRQHEALKQKDEQLEMQHTELKDSIAYALRIQRSILPLDAIVKEYMPENFIFYRPKDVVSGDFYWINKVEDKIFIAAIDCTGHGVPGAFMSVIGYTQLNHIILERNVFDPGKILKLLDEAVRRSLKQDSGESNDGMDMSLICLDYNEGTLKFAGAHNNMYQSQNGELLTYKANRFPVGGSQFTDKKFETHTVQLKSGDFYYIFTDGFPDQFGGDNNKKYKRKTLLRLLQENEEKHFDEMDKILVEEFLMWKNTNEQTDDILVIGIKIP